MIKIMNILTNQQLNINTRFLWIAISMALHLGVIFIGIEQNEDNRPKVYSFRPTIKARIQIKQEKITKKRIKKEKTLKKNALKRVKKEKVAKKEIKKPQSQVKSNTKKFDQYIKHFEKPAYPRVALRRGIEGTVEIKLVLLGTGKIISVDLLKSSGSSMLDNSALSAAKMWKFSKLSNINTEEITITKKIVFTTKL